MVAPIITAGDLAVLRADAESMLTLTLAALSPNGTTTVNSAEVPAFAAEGSTRGKLAGPSQQSQDAATRTVRVGDVEVPVLSGGLHIPINAPVPEARWEYVVTALGPADDPALLGRRYRVVGVPAKSFATARRLDVVEVPA